MNLQQAEALPSPGAPSTVSHRIGAVIVNYNDREHLLACVRSLRQSGVGNLVVADNASADGSGEALASDDPDATFMPTGGNLGYGTAANRGATRVSGDLLLICNSDLTVDRGALELLAAAMDADGRLGIVGPRIVDPDGTVYPSPRRFTGLADAVGHAFVGLVKPGNCFSRRYLMLDWDRAGFGEVDWVSGSCFLVRRAAWEDLGGFDESYFLYAEDVDLCWRAWQAGWKVGFEPAARVVHIGGATTGLAPYRFLVLHHRSALRFARRSLTGPRRAFLPLVAAGLGLRAVLACAQRAVRARRPR